MSGFRKSGHIFYENYSIDDNIRFMVLKRFHSVIVMGPGQYDYHGFKIIAQP